MFKSSNVGLLLITEALVGSIDVVSEELDIMVVVENRVDVSDVSMVDVVLPSVETVVEIGADVLELVL